MNNNLKGILSQRKEGGRRAKGRLVPLTIVKERRLYSPVASSFQIIKQKGDYNDSKQARRNCQSGNN
jgi:hypothetical protein